MLVWVSALWPRDPYSPKNKHPPGSEKARRRHPKAARNHKFWEISRQANAVGACGRVCVDTGKFFSRCGLGWPGGYKEWVDAGWVRKVIRFWQKHSPNCNFYGRSSFLSSHNLTGGSGVRGKASRIGWEKFSISFSPCSIDIARGGWYISSRNLSTPTYSNSKKIAKMT
jgi:hypothetical protein